MLLLALKLVLRRLAVAAPTLLAVSALVFVILRLLPADPAAMSLPPGASAEDLAALRAELGLDRNVAVQYARWLGDILSGDLGTSIYFRRPVADLIANALPNTLELVVAGLLLGALIGTAMGLAMNALGHHPASEALDLATSAMMAIPEFLWALLLILALGVALPVLPFFGRMAPGMTTPDGTGFLIIDALASGRLDLFVSALAHLVLPATALAIALAPLIARVLRASLAQVEGEAFVAHARLRGLSERRLLFAHVLPNAALPTVSLLGVQAGFMFGGTVLVEVIFGYPGLGNLIVDAVRNQDLPVIQAVALVYCVMVLALNASVEVLYLAINPRLRPA